MKIDKIQNNFTANHTSIILGLIFTITIPVCCVIFAALQGMSILDINPYATAWNDEAIYYKQLEGVLSHGFPQGYFGYNESTAEIGTFGAWSPVILIPYVILGFIFGLSPTYIYLFNILMVTVASLVYYIVARPNKLQVVFFYIFMMALPIAIRYTLSNMVEALFYAGVIVLAGIVEYCKKDRYDIITIIIFYVIILFLALCRPYLGAFILFPLYFHLKIADRKIIPILYSLGYVLLFIIGYFITTLLTAPYLSDIVNVSFLSILIDKGMAEFIAYFINLISTNVIFVINGIVDVIILNSNLESDIVYFTFT